MDDFPSRVHVDVDPHYKIKHRLGDIGLALVGVAGIIGTMTGPLPGISPEIWKWVIFIAMAIGTVAKIRQSDGGATTGAAPKP